jgi:hypothetical protein
MLIPKRLTGRWEFPGGIELLDVELDRAEVVVAGNLVTRGDVFVGRTSSLVVEGDIEAMQNVQWNGLIRCRRALFSGRFTSVGRLEASYVEFRSTTALNDVMVRQLRAHAPVEAKAIAGRQADFADDVVAEFMHVDQITGQKQVLVRSLNCDRISVPVLGNATRVRLPERFGFQWTRPLPPGALPTVGGTPLRDLALTRSSGGKALIHFAGHIPGVVGGYDRRLHASVDCADFQNFTSDLIILLREHFDWLSPAVQQAVECFEQRGFPTEIWRL